MTEIGSAGPGGMGPLTVRRAVGDAGPYGRGGAGRARTARPYGAVEFRFVGRDDPGAPFSGRATANGP